jgi:allophanate hydrolase
MLHELTTGTLSPTDAVAEAYRRLEQTQPAAWIAVVPRDDALARARTLQAEGRHGRPLWGVPFAVKDNIDVAGLPTTAACPAFGYRPDRTASAVQRLLDAGAVLVAKTNLDQFATGLVGSRSPYGTCHSVLDSARISGGSSSGSAVAVADHVVPFALGTDTAGSGRVPAAANGIVGLKPSRGLLPLDGVVPACRSIDCLSVFTRSVVDAGTVFDVLGGPAADSPAGPPPDRRWRIGVPRSELWQLAAEEDHAFRQTLSNLATWADVREVDVTPLLDAGQLLYGGALVTERLLTVGPLLDRDPEAVHPVVREVVGRGYGRTAGEVFRDLHELSDLAEQLAPVWREVDVVVTPTVPDIPTLAQVEADPVGVNTGLGRWTMGVNLMDLCGMTVPSGARTDGLPGSVTVLAPNGADGRVGEVAATLTDPTVRYEPRSDTASREGARDTRIELAVVGAHLRGLPLNHELTDLGGRFVRTAATAPAYRLHALPTEPPKPGMVRVAEGGGSIEAEVWSLTAASFGAFVARVPAPLTIGTVELADGAEVKGFLCEPAALDGTPDITALASWRRYLTEQA